MKDTPLTDAVFVAESAVVVVDVTVTRHTVVVAGAVKEAVPSPMTAAGVGA